MARRKAVNLFAVEEKSSPNLLNIDPLRPISNVHRTRLGRPKIWDFSDLAMLGNFLAQLSQRNSTTGWIPTTSNPAPRKLRLFVTSFDFSSVDVGTLWTSTRKIIGPPLLDCGANIFRRIAISPALQRFRILETSEILSVIFSRQQLSRPLDARNIEARGLSRLPPKQTRKRKISEIVSRITPDTDRYSVLTALEEAGIATDRFRIAREMIKQLKGIDLDALVDVGMPPQDNARTELDTGQKQVLATLVRQLTDQSALSEFGLFYDGSRVKMQNGTGATLVSKSALELLRALAGSARESGSS